MGERLQPNPKVDRDIVQFAWCVPTVSDRIAQMVVKQAIEPKLESIFLPDSYGYRPGNRLWMPLVLRVNGAGSTTGSWSSTSKACLTIFRMIFC